MSDTQPQSGEEQDAATITLRATLPGGRKITVDVRPSTTTVRDFKALLEQHHGGPPAAYLRLLCCGKKLDDDDATLSSLGVVHRTALMVIHNENWAQDQAGIAAIEKILSESDILKDSPPHVVHERVTQLCCQLDGVDTAGSTALRHYRRAALARLHALEEELRESSVDSEK